MVIPLTLNYLPATCDLYMFSRSHIREDVKYDVIFCGNPGVGKSTLLSCISEITFMSGFSWGDGLTLKAEI